jgi:hypothetical protein
VLVRGGGHGATPGERLAGGPCTFGGARGGVNGGITRNLFMRLT